ncbi:CUE domain-containing protein 1 [Acromyrmex echinatior]|uniref:CUE domain-containing protein 1 n=1 Tax=Acromyrmex echinatior TaxID=103372 RepID=F4WJ72_ACREC|nr:CUE domain-containing protein 1 [Acromyrmex echinatior]
MLSLLSLLEKRQKIIAVLRSNQGAVDTTIDQLLTMSTDNENEKIRSELEQKEELPNQVIAKSPRKDSSKAALRNSVQKWQPPLLGPLPDTFLRLPQQISDDGIDSVYSQENTMLEDERIAMFLQNEEFMAELRWNEDFLSTLEHDSKLEKCSGQTGHDDEDLFKERLKNMGKLSRRKFAQLTKVFTRSKKRGGRQLLPPTASCDDLLDPEESSKPQS